jgi:quercetin dioxygenase-like cupin family protein
MTGPSASSLPADDLRRQLALARPLIADDRLAHVAVVGDTYTILLAGKDTAGRFTLIDMLVRPSGGPPPHRHDFEETFTMLEGEIEVTFRGQSSLLRAGETANVPANAPHFFRNVSDRDARMLCICSPAGQEEFFLTVGDRVASRTSPPPELDEDKQRERLVKAIELAPRYRTQLLIPTLSRGLPEVQRPSPRPGPGQRAVPGAKKSASS